MSEMSVGGQAVIEGVMMRTPHTFTVAVRRPDGEIVLREDNWRSIWDRFRFLRWPLLRGVVVMLESLINGMQALTFSAEQAGVDEGTEPGLEGGEQLSSFQLVSTLGISFALAILLFVALPHLLTVGLGALIGGSSLNPDGVAFHLIDGLIKLSIFISYIVLISRMEDVKRVFQYHGAEHKSIYTYEAGEALTVENARKYTTLHPRCGTSFLMFVMLVSVFLFTGVFPLLMPSMAGMPVLLSNALMVLIKIPLMLPIAGISYEAIKWSGKYADNPVLGLLSRPGLWMQNLTTQEPDDAQLEVALAALKSALEREAAHEQVQSLSAATLSAATLSAATLSAATLSAATLSAATLSAATPSTAAS